MWLRLRWFGGGGGRWTVAIGLATLRRRGFLHIGMAKARRGVARHSGRGGVHAHERKGRKSLTSAPLAARMSDVAPISASTDSLKDLACAASARLLSRDDSWFSAIANACSSRLGRRLESPTSSQAVAHGVAALMTCLFRVCCFERVPHAGRRREVTVSPPSARKMFWNDGGLCVGIFGGGIYLKMLAECMCVHSHTPGSLKSQRRTS